MADARKRQAGAEELTPAMMRAAQSVFDEWWERWADVHDLNGGQGDTRSLFAAVWECWKKRR